MPNWCSTYIKFYSKDKNLITEYQKKLQEIYDAPATIENGFGNGFLGDFVNTLLADHPDTEKISYRGYLTESPNSYEIDDYGGHYVFSLSTETAWGPMLEMWSLILKKFSNGRIRLAYIAEECGCELYQFYDPDELFNFSQYKLELCIEGDNESEEFENLEEVKEYLYSIKELELEEGILDNKNADELKMFLHELTEKFEEDDTGDYIYFYQFIENTEYLDLDYEEEDEAA